MKSIELHIDYIKTINYVLYHNRIPVCKSLELFNPMTESLYDVRLTVEGDYFTKKESDIIQQIGGRQSVRITDFDLLPNVDELTRLTERVQTSFSLTVTASDCVVYTQQFEIDLLPYNYWQGTSIMPQTLASFVTPNHPAISSIVVKTAEILKQMTGSSALTAYYSNNINIVRLQIAAVFAAIHKQGIVYRTLPASFESVGQRITMPDQVLTSKTGNCIELSLLFASVLEAIGIHSGIVLQTGHAYLAVWLVNDCYPYSICDDAAFLEKAISRGINEMLVVECTQVAEEKTTFDDAVALAERNLADLNVFEMFIDIKRCRLERILPLPIRIQVGQDWVFDTEGVEHDACAIDVTQHDRYDLSKIGNASKNPTKFDIWERKLLDFTLRNSLLNLTLRQRAIQFISFDIDSIEDHLQDGEEYCIMCEPLDDCAAVATDELIRSKLNIGLQELIRNDIEHHLLRTYRSENETKQILTKIYRTARTTLEETGANSLFLSIGALRWYENEASDKPRYAPILLLPVEMVYKKGNYYIRTRDEGIVLNITLIEFLSQNYDIRIQGIDALPYDESGVDVNLIFAAIRDALKVQKRWDIEEECVLGLFSFSKFLMWNDIHYHRQQLLENKVIHSLVENHLTWQPKPFTANLKAIDQQISPTELALPVPVDSSQMAAVIEAEKGQSFILYGPPGTGKSQTITNLIANALYHGKRVLFVAEKMAALNVVQSRLEKIGLEPFCLELHSNKSSKRHILEQLEKAIKVSHIVSPAEFSQTADKLFEERKELIAYMNALHEIDATDGLSLYDCILRYEAIKEPSLANFEYSSALDAEIAKNGIKAIEELLGSRLETILKLVGQPSEHPLNGMHVTREMLFNSRATMLAMHADKETLTKAKESVESLKQAQAIHEQLLLDNQPTILNEDAKILYQEWRKAKSKWFIPRLFAKRNFITKLKKYNPFITEQEVEPLIGNLLTYKQQHQQIEQLHAILSKHFGIKLQGEALPDGAMLDRGIAQLNKWTSHEQLMRDWLHWSEYAQELQQKGLSCIVSALQSTQIDINSLREAYLKALFRYKIEKRILQSPTLMAFEGMIFDEKVAAYKDMAETFQLLTQKELYAKLASRIPRLVENLAMSSEIGLLNRNISNGGRGLSIRNLFEQIPTLLPRLCPCMLMSPMSVAQYLDLSQDKFDLVVFDEASQMPTCESVGAIARGKTLVVVGDPKQMPPTSFFMSSNVNETEVSIDDMESILEDCQTLGMSSLQLSWHYRSRHESLIAFSNNEYYEGSLITFPSADDQQFKVHHIPIEGYYDKGGKRQNQAEAAAIIKEIERRLSDETLRRQSIGVISFSIMQQSLIEDMLQTLLDNNKDLHDAALEMHEPIFVKNLENVQGDERDVILFSIGYGPDRTGKVSMYFGPLNNAGGERRLNVAVTRAREEMYVYSTLKASDIDLKRSQAKGVEGLKHFLSFAETQSITSIANNKPQEQDQLLATQIAQALQQKGYVTSTNVGRSHFKVDIAISDKADPKTYRLGILLDGRNYNNTHTTRDREIVQPSVLAALNWQVMRVWSIDWYNNPSRVIQRIEERLSSMPSVQPASPIRKVFSIEDEPLEIVQPQAFTYAACEITEQEASSMSVHELMQRIIAVEQPITPGYLCRRICGFRGLGRVTPSLQSAVKQLTKSFYQDKTQAIWMGQDDCYNFKGYRTESGRDITEIPQVELLHALTETLDEQIALNIDNLILIATKKLGFSRRGTNVQTAFENALLSLEKDGLIEKIGDNIRLKNSLK